MNRFSKLFNVIGIVIAVVAAGLLLGWLGTRGGTSGRPTPTATAVPDHTPASNPLPQNNPHAKSADPMPAVSIPQVAAIDPATEIYTNWEDHLDGILTAEKPEADKAKDMLALYNHLPTEAKPEVAPHICNLVGDEDYAALGKLLADPTQPEDVLNIFYGDVLNRPNHLKLPELLDVAQAENHPKASDAVELLKLFLDEDYGQDWTAWKTKLDDWLKANPD